MIYEVKEKTDFKGLPSFYFQNQYNVTYSLFFKDYTFAFWDEIVPDIPKVLMFVLNASEQRPKHDINVEKTIVDTLLRILVLNNVVLYFCDDSDNRELIRSITFAKWFHKSQNKKKYIFKEAEMRLKDKTIFVGMLYLKDSIFSESVQQAFDKWTNSNS